jgi:hypothetical protein
MAVVFALMSMAGAWFAWHRSPVYAGQSAFRVMAGVGLLLLAAILAIVATFNYIYVPGRSATLQLVLMGAVVMVVTLGLIFSIQAVATPKSSRLNTTLLASVRTLTVHRDHFWRWAKYVLGVLALSPAGLLVPGNTRDIIAGLFAVPWLLAPMMLLLLYVNARKFDLALTVLTLDPWIHWQYSTGPWQAWCDVQAARLGEARTFSLRRDWRRFPLMFVAMGAVVMIFSPLTLWQNALCVMLMWGFILGMFEFSVWATHRAPAKLRVKLHDASPESYFGHDGLYCNGRFVTWLGAEYYLTAASIDARPPRSLKFQFEKIVPNPYGPAQTIFLDQSVLIPDGADGDIVRLAHELASRCPNASIALT